jgi:putative transcription factor
MCGRETQLVKARVEGTVLDICESCARFGEIISRPSQSSATQKKQQIIQPVKRKEVVQLISSDFASKIKNAREKLGLNQEEFAKRLNEKWSLLQKIESGQFKPSITLAGKLEKILRIRIIEQFDEGGEIPLGAANKKSSSEFTLGDFVKVRKRKE